jgi:hypothetical protein
MPSPSRVDQLSDEDKQTVVRLLEEHNFSNYQGIAELLAEHDIVISKSSLHRFGSKYAEGIARLKESTRVAIAVKESLGDDNAEMGNIVSQLALSQCMDLLMTMQVDPEKVDFPKLVAAVSKLVAANVVVKEYREKIRLKLVALADELDSELQKPGGISDEFALELKRKFLGIAA